LNTELKSGFTVGGKAKERREETEQLKLQAEALVYIHQFVILI